MKTWKVAFVSVVPSPYQRDLFGALAERPEMDLRVYYLEASAPDSPWPEKPLCSYERIMPGTWISLGTRRVHINWSLPDPADYDLIVMNTLMSCTGQWLMRSALKSLPWIFWGERLTGHGAIHRFLTAPLQRASGIAAIGRLAEDDYAKRFPRSEVFPIPYHCQLAPFLEYPRPERTSKETVFLFCGQMIHRKGIDLLLQAFSRVENARLLLVGREAELPLLLSSYPEAIRQRIDYAGFASPDDLPKYFAQADAFILPSRHDGWGVVVNQALGAGLALICSDAVGAAHDLIEPEINGIRFPSGDVEALAKAMRRLIQQPEMLQGWGNASRAKACEWTPTAGAQKWVNAFQRILRA